MRILSVIMCYLSYLLAFYAVFLLSLKVSDYGSGFLIHSKLECLGIAAAIVLQIISRQIKPKIATREDGRTVTKHL